MFAKSLMGEEGMWLEMSSGGGKSDDEIMTWRSEGARDNRVEP